MVVARSLLLKFFEHNAEALLHRVAIFVLISHRQVASDLRNLLFETASVLLGVTEVILLFYLDFFESDITELTHGNFRFALVLNDCGTRLAVAGLSSRRSPLLVMLGIFDVRFGEL